MRWISSLLTGLVVYAIPTDAPGREPPLDRLEREHPGVRIVTNGSQITRVYGPPFAFGTTPTQAADSFLRAHSDLLGVAPADLVPAGTQDVMNGTFTAVYYTQRYHGVPVDRAWVTLLVRHDVGNGVVLVSPNLHDLRGVTLAPAVISGTAAVARVQQAYPDFTFTSPELVVYVGGDTPLYAYRFVGGNQDRANPEKYEFIVDASRADAPIVHLESRIYYGEITGRVTALATPGDRPDRDDNPPVELPLDHIRVRVAGGNVGLTAEDGQYVIVHDGIDVVTVETGVSGVGETLAGPWVTVNDAGASAPLALTQDVLPPGPADFLFNAVPAEFNTAQVNGFIHTTAVHDFVKAINPAYPGVDIQIPCNVNIDASCNAYYDGTAINFFRRGGGCPNMAYSSVVYHEYGHHIVAVGHPAAAEDFHEGVADTTSNLLIDTACTGRQFRFGSNCLRSAYNCVSYPSLSKDPHLRGQALSGAYWLLRDFLTVTEPDDYLDIARALYLNMILLRPGGLGPEITLDVLTLDDDDGDVSNGTPHYFEITRAFGAKNLGLGPSLDFTYPDGRPQKLSPLGGTRVRVAVAPGVLDPQPGTARLHYSTGGDYDEILMETVGDGIYEAAFPVLECGTVVRYYVSAAALDGMRFTDPPDGPAAPFVAYAAYTLNVVFSDSFDGDLGWTRQDGAATTGGWTRVDPIGSLVLTEPAQPEDDNPAGLGDYCYVTGQGSRSSSTPEQNDLDGGPTSLVSPVLMLAGTDPLVRYYRWFFNDTGDDTLVAEVSNDDGANWAVVEAASHDPGWRLRVFRLADFVVPSDQVRLRFRAADAPNNSVTEAAIDDVQVVTLGCQVVFGKGDLNCDGLVNAGDIPPFILALTAQTTYQAAYENCDFHNADTNDDGALDETDVQGFVELLIQ